MAQFKLNKEADPPRYDVIGLESEVKPGELCEVTLKNGSTKVVEIDKVSKPFTAKFGDLSGKQAVIGTVMQHEGED
jgi:hypothetical protein